MLKNFRVLNFRVKKFSWSWLDHVPRNFLTRVKLAMYEYQLQWCVKWEAAVGEELKGEK